MQIHINIAQDLPNINVLIEGKNDEVNERLARPVVLTPPITTLNPDFTGGGNFWKLSPKRKTYNNK